jgi:hypothetical protein
MNKYPHRIIGAALTLIAIWLAFKMPFADQDDLDSNSNSIVEKRPENYNHKNAKAAKSTASERKTKSAIRPDPKQHEDKSHKHDSADINELLGDPLISNDETATRLATIALDPNVPESKRLEAMEHAANLGFSHLLPLSLDINLPLSLTECFLSGLYAHDQMKEKISGALGLLNHTDPETREQAQILLGSLLDAEEDIESPSKLREKARILLSQADEETKPTKDSQ